MENVLWILVFLGLSFLPMVCWRDKSRDAALDPKNLFIIYLAIQIGITGFVTVLSGESTIFGADPLRYADLYSRVFMYASAGIAAFHLGDFFVRSRLGRGSESFQDRFDQRRTTRLLFVAYAIGYGLFFVFLQSQGGLSTFLNNRELFRNSSGGGGQIIIPPAVMMPYASVIYAISRLNPKSTNREILLVALAIALALPPAVILGFRWLLIPPMLFFGLIYQFRCRKMNFKKVGLALAGFVIVFSVYGIQRNIAEVKHFGVELKPDMINGRMISNQIFTRSMGAEVVSTVVKSLDHSGGYANPINGLVEAATIVVPRDFWPDKPVPRTIEFTTTFFGSIITERDDNVRQSYGGVSPTAIGEFYCYGGVVAVLAMMFAFGVIASMAYRFLLANPRSDMILIGFLIAFWSIGYAAEAPQLALNEFVTNGICVFAMAIFVVKKVARPSQG